MSYKMSCNVDMYSLYQEKYPWILKSVAIKPIKFQEMEKERKYINVGKQIRWVFTLKTTGASDQVKNQKL